VDFSDFPKPPRPHLIEVPRHEMLDRERYCATLDVVTQPGLAENAVQRRPFLGSGGTKIE
jgi:hypothetical protein